MLLFIQTDGLIIEASKITFMRIEAKNNLTVHFVGGTSVKLKACEAERFFHWMKQLDRERQIVTRGTHAG